MTHTSSMANFEAVTVGPISSELTRDALAEVFSKLPFQDLLTSVPLVCKGWREASLYPLCWRSVDMQKWFDKKTEEKFDWEFECEPQMEFLVKMVVDRSCGQLKELRTMHCSDAALEYIADNCHSLTALAIKESMLVTDDSAQKLAIGCPKLEELDVSDCYHLSSTSLEALGRNCKSLVWLARNMLHKDHYFLPGDESLPGGDDDEAIAMAKHMVNLRHLEMQKTSLTNVGVWHLARGCRNLETLNLAACIAISPSVLDDLKLPHLKKFTKPIVPRMHVPAKQLPATFFAGIF